MSENKFRSCQTLKKEACINLIKKNLTLQQLSEIFKPDFNTMIKLIGNLSKKDLQYIIFGSATISNEIILDEIRNENYACEEINVVKLEPPEEIPTALKITEPVKRRIKITEPTEDLTTDLKITEPVKQRLKITEDDALKKWNKNFKTELFNSVVN